jgi:hypothetical protein
LVNWKNHDTAMSQGFLASMTIALCRNAQSGAPAASFSPTAP